MSKLEELKIIMLVMCLVPNALWAKDHLKKADIPALENKKSTATKKLYEQENSPKIKFKKGYLKINNKKLTIEVAETPDQHAFGLMERNSLPENFGMLFVFPDEEQRFFWMKNTFVDLSIAYIGKNKKIIDIQDMKAATSSLDANLPSYPSRGKAMYALEVNQGWFSKNGIKVGNYITEFKILK